MEEGKKRYTPVLRSGEGAIFTVSEFKCPFVPLDGLDYAPLFSDMFEEAYENSFIKKPLGKEWGFASIISFYDSYRNFFFSPSEDEREEAETKRMFIHDLDRQLGQEAADRVSGICSIPDDELCYAVRQWNVSFYSFRRNPLFDMKGRKAIVVIRTRPSLRAFLSSSFDGVERAFRKMAEGGTYTSSSLIEAVAGVKDEIREEIGEKKEKMARLLIEKAEGMPDRNLLTSREDRIESCSLKIRRAEITLSYLDAFVRQTEDYLGSDTPSEPLSKRILSDALLTAEIKWEADAPGFLTAEDLNVIVSDRRLRHRTRWGDSCIVYMKEMRPLTELHDFIMKGNKDE